MILFIDGCPRQESRTRILAQAVLSRLTGPVTQVALYPDGPEGLTEETMEQRRILTHSGQFDAPMLRWARQFAAADTIVLAAPYWDLLFPAKVRAYLEAVTVSGLTFFYDETGCPRGLCKAKRLIYVSTAGGPVFQHFGFDYVKALAESFYGIGDVQLIQAQGLDLVDADSEALLQQAIHSLPAAL